MAAGKNLNDLAATIRKRLQQARKRSIDLEKKRRRLSLEIQTGTGRKASFDRVQRAAAVAARDVEALELALKELDGRAVVAALMERRAEAAGRRAEIERIVAECVQLAGRADELLGNLSEIYERMDELRDRADQLHQPTNPIIRRERLLGPEAANSRRLLGANHFGLQRWIVEPVSEFAAKSALRPLAEQEASALVRWLKGA